MDSNENQIRDHEIDTDPVEKQSMKERTEQDHEMDQDCQTCKEEDRPKECGEQTTDACQGSDSEKEGEGSERKAELGCPDGETDQNGDGTAFADDRKASEATVNQEKQTETPTGYSCSYTPPYYVPNFTVVNPTTPSNTPKESKAHHGKWIALCVAICLVVSLVVGSTAGYLCARHFDIDVVPGGASDSATVTKNDGSIIVNEIVGSTGYDHLTVAEVVQYVADSVVEITTSQVQNDSFWGNFVTGGAGSGVIIDSGGYIITNNHVVDGATSITVSLTSGKEYPATVVGGDADSDIAVLKIEETGLKAAVLGKSSDLKVGQDVVAIGNPLGELGGTVTDGIISALDRQVIVDGYPMTLLQTNAAINPGNSGGGLFNMAGELVGIVNAKQADTGIEGLGFAIPIDVAWQKASDLMKYGYVTGKVILDFTVEAHTSDFRLQNGNGFFATTYTFPAGVYVVSGENSDLQKYDRIVSINGITVNGISDYYSLIQNLKKGDELKLVISRLDTSGLNAQFREHTVTMTVKVTEPNA